MRSASRWTYYCLPMLCLSLFVLLAFLLPKIEETTFTFSEEPNQFLTQYTYEAPKQTATGRQKLVRIEILIRDSPEAAGVQIHSVEFNQKNIPLKPRDIYGNRGSASFQLLPGTYKLRWVVQRDRFAWPRLLTHDQEVTIDPRDLWIQIYIEGDEASIR